VKNPETSSIKSISKLISSYAPSLPGDMLSGDSEDERRHEPDNPKDKPGIPEHAPIEYICLLYRL
jgi:hypothetical protein